jgi:Tol biopolymer transport system component
LASPIISPESISQHLEAVLASKVFAGAARQQRLLRHLVERHLQGRSPELKEYTLGVEVFDRGADFDPRLDPIVRVEASRLRARLLKYYEAAGNEADLRIELPRGAYLPTFRRESVLPAPPEPPPTLVAPAGPALRARRIWPAITGSSLITIGVALLWFGRSDVPPAFANFTRVTNEQARCTNPALSPDGRTIVYARLDSGRWDLYLKQLGSVETRNLTRDSQTDNTQPAFSPDGRQIAFRSERDGGGIFLMNLGGGAIRRIASAGYHPAWSPDGRRVAVSTGTFVDPAENSVGRASHLQIVDVGTGIVRPLVIANVYEALQPAWSPNGARLAFWGRDDKGIRDIWTISVEGNVPADPISSTRDIWTDWSPAWSPDGRFLYYSSDRGGSMNLWRIAIDEKRGQVSGPAEPVTTPSAYSGWPAFSKDGSRFAYVRRLFSSRLYRIDFDPEHGGRQETMHPITAGARRVREPDMSPDGTQLVVRVQDPQEDIAIISPDGKDIRRLTHDTFSDRLPRWSPNGRFIAFLSNRSGRFETWAVNPDGSNLHQQARPDRFPPDVPTGFLPLASSPAGSRVLGRLPTQAGGEDLAVFTRATRDIWRIPTDAPSLSAAWLDESRFVFSRADGFYAADFDTRRIRPIVSGLKSNLHSRFTLSHDMQTLFFALSEDQEDIWTASR